MEKIKEIGAEEIYLAPETSQDPASAAEKSADRAPQKKVFAVNEIPELREECRKVFRMSDGSEQAVFYPQAVHTLDEQSRQFVEVDNTLVEEEDRLHFRNGKNRFVARFSKNESSDELFSVEKDTYGITVYTKRTKKQQGTPMVSTLHKRRRVKDSDTLTFLHALSSAELEYAVTGNGVKENIVVKDLAEVYRYTFVLDCRNVKPNRIPERNEIGFISTENGEEIFRIPAPFMTDAAGTVSTGVVYELKPQNEGKYLLTLTADSEWINAPERSFPVTIDPQIEVSSNAYISTYSWNDGRLYNAAQHTVGTTGNGDGACNAARMYMSLNLPTLPQNPRIKKAELTFRQSNASHSSGALPKLGLYQVQDDIVIGECTPVNSDDLLDYARMQTEVGENEDIVSYTFDITSLLDAVLRGETSYRNLVLKMLDESDMCQNSVTLYGSTDNSYAPQISVTYDPNVGSGTSYRTHTHDLGRFGQGSIDLQCGNLMLESDDFAWGGNRMPVTIRHQYNSSLCDYAYTANEMIGLHAADFSAMHLGTGWKLNVMQSMKPYAFQYEGVPYEGYLFVDENGGYTLFKESAEKRWDISTAQCYHLYEDVESGEMIYDPRLRQLKTGGNRYRFDTAGRLTCILDEYDNQMDVTYTDNKITSVTDGAERSFGFGYNPAGYLTSITAPDGSHIVYTYSGDNLSSVTYPDGRKAEITSIGNKPTAVVLKDAADNPVYKVTYEYTHSGGRIEKVSEFGVENGAFVAGVSSSYAYSASSGSTVVQTTEPKDEEEGETEDSVIKTVYTFDDDGNIVSEYVYTQDTGNIGANGEESGIHPHSGDNGAGAVRISHNLLLDHNFDTLENWIAMPNNTEKLSIRSYPYETQSKFGIESLLMQTMNEEAIENGVYQTVHNLPAGEYTFSCYLDASVPFKGEIAPGAYLRVVDASGAVLEESEHLSGFDTGFTRVILPFELTVEQSVQVQILMNGNGQVYVDAAQLENNPFATPYNMIQNGNFENGSGWTCCGASYVNGNSFNMRRSLRMVGDLDSEYKAWQKVSVHFDRQIRETFTLSGWAKGYGLPNHDRPGLPAPHFRLRAVIKYKDDHYKDYGEEVYTADFSPCTEEWQFASVQFSKAKYRAVEEIRVYCDYDNNSGVVYFDDIQLVRDSMDTKLTSADFEEDEPIPAEDPNAIEDPAKTESDTEKEFEEEKDFQGNTLTETTFFDGEFGTIYRSFGFSYDENNLAMRGNDLVRETDPRGNDTKYKVDEETSRNEEVTDRCGNKTAYEYDSAGRTVKVTSKDASGTELATVSYAYDSFDNMTEIVRGDGLKYALTYNAYHNLESIGVHGMTAPLVQYDYKAGNGRLKQMTYANGDRMKAIYNGLGQMVAEKWYDKDNTLTAHYKYVYDGEGKIVRSIDIESEKEYTYTYDEGKIVRAAECNITVGEQERIIAKSVLRTVVYVYDNEDKLIRKRIYDADGSHHDVWYNYTDDDNTVVRFSAGGRRVTSHSKTDAFGRNVFDELQVGDGFVSRQFHYHNGEYTEQHKESIMLKSSPTTQLVSEIVFHGGRTLSYEYDAEERITKVTDSAGIITKYTYDPLGQLLTETVNDEVVNSMTYDKYGNIREKNGKVYGYDTVWKDRLICVDGVSITYDPQGNPTSYLDHTLTWEKGRQLKSFDGNTYTYNANGIRTGKTVGGIRHDYFLDGAKILSETWCENTLTTLFDNEDSVCGVIYNGTPYYFLKNLQGDIIALINQSGETVAEYSYDAWGVPTITRDISDCSIATVNPYRYRGYYYDQEIGMYYLQSRYYDPVVGRFVNGDEAEYIGAGGAILSYNLFAYCENDLINSRDTSGSWIARAIVAAVSATIFGAIAYAIGRAVGLNKTKLAWFTAGFVAVGTIVGAIWGIGFLKTVNRLIKPVIYFFTNPGKVYFGLKLLNLIQFEIHYSHHNKPIHFVIRWFFGRNPGFKDWWFGK